MAKPDSVPLVPPRNEARDSSVASLLVDAERFPRAASFLSGLPEGLASYPDCQQKASILWAMLDGRSVEVPRGSLPAVVVELLRNPPPPNVWLPATVGRLAWLALLDLRYPDDDAAALDWADRAYADLSRSPMYSLLVRQLSPSVIVHGASHKWRALYRGVDLEMAEMHTHGATGTLRYPMNLFPRFNAISTGRGLAIALRASRARNPRVAMTDWSPTLARYEVRWST